MRNSSTKKDAWDKLSIVISALIPISVAAVGGYYSWAMKQAEIVASKDKLQIEIVRSRVEQAKLVHTFTKSLTSDDSNTRKIAISAVVYALPEHGKKLVEDISLYDSSEEIRNYAQRRLRTIIDEGIEYKLRSCGVENDLLYCDILLQSTTADKIVGIDPGSVEMMDSEGNLYRPKEIVFGNKYMKTGRYEDTIISGWPTLLTIKFSSDNQEKPVSPILIRFNSNGLNLVFRNIKISRK